MKHVYVNSNLLLQAKDPTNVYSTVTRMQKNNADMKTFCLSGLSFCNANPMQVSQSC